MIDWKRVQVLRDEVGQEDFEEIVTLFLEEVENALNALPSDQAQNTLGETLHFLKGSALSLGFESFSTSCYQGELAAERKQVEAIDIETLHRVYLASKESFLADLPKLNAA